MKVKIKRLLEPGEVSRKGDLQFDWDLKLHPLKEKEHGFVYDPDTDLPFVREMEIEI